MIELFVKGGPIMWPLLLTSVVGLTVVVERLLFTMRERYRRQRTVVEEILTDVERGDISAAIQCGGSSSDFVARTLVSALSHPEEALPTALLRAANLELKRFNRGLAVLDTIVTLAPLLGLLGTVTGMIRAFGLLGVRELETPIAITGGIAEALIATAFGLGIAIVALVPFNFLNSKLEEARHEIEDTASHVELLLLRGRHAVGAFSQETP